MWRESLSFVKGGAKNKLIDQEFSLNLLMRVQEWGYIDI